MKNTLKIDIEAEKKEILKRYRALLRASKSTLQKGDKKEIRKAFEMALESHKDMRRIRAVRSRRASPRKRPAAPSPKRRAVGSPRAPDPSRR